MSPTLCFPSLGFTEPYLSGMNYTGHVWRPAGVGIAKSHLYPGSPPVLVETDPHLTCQLSGKAERILKIAPMDIFVELETGDQQGGHRCPGMAQLLGGLPMAGAHWPALIWTSPASVPIEQDLFPWQFQKERIPDRAESLGWKSRCSI